MVLSRNSSNNISSKAKREFLASIGMVNTNYKNISKNAKIINYSSSAKENNNSKTFTTN